jgi:hypothetical protein
MKERKSIEMKTQLEDLNHKWHGLLETIRALQASVGDGLTDNEVTRLLRESALPIEAGFKFLSFSDWFVTLTVPRQELANWYPEKGWIVPEKEGIARAIAKKYELFFFEPPDVNSSALYPQSDSPGPHHHLELNNREETVVVAHPQYLKIRLFKGPSGFVHALGARIPLLLSPELLQDLSFLYKSESVLGGGKASLREDDVISEPTEVMKPSSHAKGMERRQPHQRKMVRQQIQLGRQSVPGR